MKKLLLMTLSLLLSATSLSAQTSDRGPYSAVQVSIIPPLSTNGREAKHYTNDFSFNLLAGVSRNERALVFGGLANMVGNSATGVQFAGLANFVGGKSTGVQFGGLFNGAGIVDGVQFAGLGNLTGVFEGVQFGGLFNMSAHFNGLQFGGVGNMTGNFEGVQFGGLANVAGNVEGVQFGGFNVAGIFEGIQFGHLGNLTSDFEGIQFGGLFNVANDVDGLQWAGLFNVADHVDGVQFAGLVNIAESGDYPIGLVNIIRDGEKGVAVGYNELGTMSLTFRSGGRVLYGILGVGYNHEVEDRGDALSFVAGYGAHIDICRNFRIKNEFTSEQIGSFDDGDGNAFKAGYALLPAFRAGRFEIFAGPSANYMRAETPNMYNLLPKHSLWERDGKSGLRQRAYIGWQAGVQVCF